MTTEKQSSMTSLGDALVVNTSSANEMVPEILENMAVWHHARNLIDGSDDKSQFLKFIEEVGELAGNFARGKPIQDDVGDAIVVLLNHCERNKITMAECLLTAWIDIKDRRGRMIDGVFVKEADL